MHKMDDDDDDVSSTLFRLSKPHPNKISLSLCPRPRSSFSLLFFPSISRVFTCPLQNQNPTQVSESASPFIIPLNPSKPLHFPTNLFAFSSQSSKFISFFPVTTLSLSLSLFAQYHLHPTIFMAKTKPGKKDLDSYTIKGTNKIVRRGLSFSLSSLSL